MIWFDWEEGGGRRREGGGGGGPYPLDCPIIKSCFKNMILWIKSYQIMEGGPRELTKLVKAKIVTRMKKPNKIRS